MGYAEAHLMASVSIDGLRLWTRDKALAAWMGSFGLAFHP